MSLSLRGSLKGLVCALGLLFAAAPAAAQPADAQALDLLQRFAQASAAGDSAAAAEPARALLDLPASDLGLLPEEHLELRAQLAEALAAAGDLEGAIAAYETILAEQEQIFGPDAIELVPTLERLVELAVESRASEPNALVTRAMSIVSANLGADHPRMASLLRLRADYLRRAGNAAQLRETEARLAALEDAAEARRDPVTTMGGGRDLDPEPPGPAADDEADDDFDLVRVFYGTSRLRSGRRGPTEFFSGQRAPADREIETGIVTVSVPRNRELGAIPKPSIWRGEFRPDPALHVILEDLETFPDVEAFAAELRRTMDRSQRREAFVYVHGFSNTFDQAAERTAQLAVDLEIDGAPILYSWPSQGGLLGYVADGAQVVRPVVDDLEAFLMLVAEASGAERLHLVAHSMGNRYLIEALEEIADERPDDAGELFDEVVFAAPDVDAEDFAARLPDVQELAQRLTLYASDQDRALQLSMMVNGGYRRAGDASRPLVLAGLDTVDTSPAPTPSGSFRHNDAFDQALDDFRSVIWFSLSPEDRCLLDRRPAEDGVFWLYDVPEPDACNADVFKAAITMRRRLGQAAALQLLDNQVEMTRIADDDESSARWAAVRDIVRGIGE